SVRRIAPSFSTLSLHDALPILVARARKLKVFQAQIGFYDTVVAAPSQAAALRAWGIRQNLFADGLARTTDEPQAVEAALATPERSEEHTSELQSHSNLVCRLLH